MSAKVQGYLPTDRPDLVTSLVSGLQILVAIFPATVLVAVLTKFDVGATLCTSGVSTLAAVLGSRNRIPFYYGSSFSFIAAVTAIVAANGTMGVQIAQGGIVAAGVVEVLAGLLVYYLGKKWIDRILPPILTGSIAMVIGIGLAKAALAIGSTVLIIGIGGNLPGSLLGIKEPPAIAAAAVFGLLLNLFFIMIRPEKVESAMGVSQAGD